MKKLAILPALLAFSIGFSSCEKNQVDPAPSAVAYSAIAANSLTQGKTVTSTTSGTYPYQFVRRGVTVDTTGTFTSTLRISSFEVQNGVITGIGTLSATPTSGPATAYGPVAVQIPLALSQLSSSCSATQVNYGPQTVMLNNTAVTVNPVLNVSPTMSNKNLLGNLMCSLGRLLGNPSAADKGGVVSHLNKIISEIGS